VIIPWDLDTILHTPTERLFRPTVPAVRRLLNWPPAGRQYAETVVEALASYARPDLLATRAAPTNDFGDPAEVTRLTDAAPQRAAYLDPRLPKKIEAGVGSGVELVSRNSTWPLFQGHPESLLGNRLDHRGL